MDLSDVLGELEDRYPDVDWDAVKAVPLGNYTPEVIADVLIDAGCDPETVKHVLLDD